ncbi:MAG TPA: adenylate/guanylate cyclase domain-containing protein [Anaerolineae bacterium]|nr:adenylate/guanylate cyclase domain-containing protein [Anaerolineae bacterium]
MTNEPITTDNGEQLFQTSLNEAMVASEQLRATILSILFAASIIPLFILLIVAPEFYAQLFGNNLNNRTIVSFLLLIALIITYELVIKRFLARQKDNYWRLLIIRYLNAIEEPTFISILIVLIAYLEPPVSILIIPPVWIYFILIILSALRLDFKLCVLTGVVCAAQYQLLVWYYGARFALIPNMPLFETFLHMGKSSVLVIAGVVTGIVTLQIRGWIVRSLDSVAERNRVQQLFGQHVSPAVVDKLLQQDNLQKNEMRSVCILFLDIRDFTQFAEQHAPDEVVNYLNTLFDFMVSIINDHHGIVNKFLGDGFMAIFGAPFADGQEARYAVAAAEAILTAVEVAIARGDIPPTRIGIGIHAGPAMTGNIGSHIRQEYTVIGDVVNVAARIEQLNKQFDSQLLVSETVWHQTDLTTKDALLHPHVPIRGHEATLNLYQLK